MNALVHRTRQLVNLTTALVNFTSVFIPAQIALMKWMSALVLTDTAL